jgi:uncharacterized protein (TIGR02172 family)
MEYELIGSGRTADVFVCENECVLKLYRESIDAGSIANEFNAAVYAYENNLPTPKPVSRVRKDNRYGIVFSKIAGRSLLNILSEKPMRMARIAVQMARLHHRINSVAYPDAVNSQKQNMITAIASSGVLSEDEKNKITAYIDTLPDERFLCHGDFHPDNIMIDDDVWIIDWMTGTSGSPACDAARCKMILECSDIPDSIPAVMRFLLSLGKKALAAKYVKEYCRISGLHAGEIDKWMLPLYAARLAEDLSGKETARLLKRIKKEIRKVSRLRDDG